MTQQTEGRTFTAPPEPPTDSLPTPAGFVRPFDLVAPGTDVPPFLRERATGQIWPYSDEMGRRGDLMEPYFGDPTAVRTEVAPAPVAAAVRPAPPTRRAVPVEEALQAASV